MNRFALEHTHLAPKSDEEDPLIGLLVERGITHEDAKEQKLRDAMLDYAIYGVRLAA